MCQLLSTVELIADAEGIYDGADTVQNRQAVGSELRHHLRVGAECLRDRCGFTDSRCLDDDVVERFLRAQVMELGHQIHLERAADTAVLECYQRVIVLTDHPALLNERGVDIHLADIIDDNGEANTFVIGQNTVQQGCFTAAEIAGDQ